MTKRKYPKQPDRVPMWLPSPSDEAVSEFMELPQVKELGLTDLESRDLATRLLRLYYLLNFAYPGREELAGIVAAQEGYHGPDPTAAEELPSSWSGLHE